MGRNAGTHRSEKFIWEQLRQDVVEAGGIDPGPHPSRHAARVQPADPETDVVAGATFPLVAVANRLPVRRNARSARWEVSPGGLVSALKSVIEELDQELAWIGWTGEVDDAPAPFRNGGIHIDPIRLDSTEVENYYHGFANGTLWPLYHDAMRTPRFHRRWWHPYVTVNRRFAEAAAARLAPDGVAWVHDYHLHLVPKFLRELRPDVKISHFLHIPFPPEELFAQLPWRGPVLEGMLASDIIGFQTPLGAQNFLRCAQRFTSATVTDGQLEFESRPIRAAAFPISVDVAKFREIAARPEVIARAERLKRDLKGRTLLLGVDRLDYTKGIDQRLRAFETLCQNHPQISEKCVFVQIAVPSREEVLEYQDMRTQVEQVVSRINGQFGRPGHAVVQYFYRSFPLEELVAYYLAADVMVVTPLRDGMNLVAKEYVATRRDDSGALVLSEFAGAAQELRRAYLVNPHDIDGLAATYRAVLATSAEDRRERMAAMRTTVQASDVQRWARQCLELVH